MIEDARSSRRHTLRTFAAGALFGALAGVFLLSVIVWNYGNVIGSRNAADLHPADPPSAMARWQDSTHDAGAGVLDVAEETPAATTGTVPATVPGDVPKEGGAVIGPTASSPVELEDRDLEMPVEGISPEQLTPQFDQPRGGVRKHEAIDILAPRNTPVKAVEDGRIARLFHSKAGGITIYQYDPTERFCYYYAHLERYASGLKEGGPVRKGQVIGYVGTSGNAPKDTPHLHFAIFRLTGEKRWWEGTPIDPYDVLR
jgi:murein DD-endopeptidase MepM/ murein hydrolase activator NlpD